MTKPIQQPPQNLPHASHASIPPQQGHSVHPPLPDEDRLYEVGYQLALDHLGYKGMQSKIFADAFIGEYERALQNGLSNVLAIRFAAEFAGPYALAFTHFLTANIQREEETDIYGEARIFAEMSFDNFEQQFAEDFAPILAQKTEEKNLKDAISKALSQDITVENLAQALQNDRAMIYKKGHADGYGKGFDDGKAEGFEDGKVEGKKFGVEEGRSLGYQEAKKELSGM